MEVEIPTSTELRGPYASNTDHLLDEFARLDLLIRAQVIRWQQSVVCAGPEREWGMVVVSQEEVDRYISAPSIAPAALANTIPDHSKTWIAEAAWRRIAIDLLCRQANASELRLVRLSELFGLDQTEKDILLLSLLVEIDERYRRLSAYLQNDASRQTLSVELIIQILQGSLVKVDTARDLFSSFGSLLAGRLIWLGGESASGESLAQRSVRIDDRIASYLLGSDEPDGRLAGVVERFDAGVAETIHARAEVLAFLGCLPDALRPRLEEGQGARLLMSGKDPRLAAKVSSTTCQALRLPMWKFDVRLATQSPHSWELLVDIVYREAHLTRAAILFQHCDALFSGEQDRRRWEYLERSACRSEILTIAEADSSEMLPSSISDARFLHVDLPLPDYETRRRIWDEKLPASIHLSLTEAERESLVADLAGVFQITEAQIEDAVDGARNLSRRQCPAVEQISRQDLFEACRRQSGHKLITFAQRIEPHRNLSIDDLVLPEPNKRQLLDLQNRIRHHGQLFQRTGFEQTMRLGKGLLALFAGGSGTGKTLAAEALASGHGVDLYKVDLSAVTSKWVGETEKNLSRIFAEAESSSGCGWLFFDEGESLFGSRGDIKHAQDRLLNLEVNYLLQRIEDFSGVVILATNLRQNIDDAFLRRIHALVEFPQPNAESRAAIWKKLMPEAARRDFDDQQLARLAARFELSGGNIRNIVLDAMFRACATEGKSITLRHLAAGIAREFQKLGRPITSAEFGNELYNWVVADILQPAPTTNTRSN